MESGLSCDPEFASGKDESAGICMYSTLIISTTLINYITRRALNEQQIHHPQKQDLAQCLHLHGLIRMVCPLSTIGGLFFSRAALQDVSTTTRVRQMIEDRSSYSTCTFDIKEYRR